MSSGSRSSVQKAIRSVPYSSTSGRRSTRFRAIDASRISSHMPARSRWRPSSTVSASWSERMPEAAYAFSALPRTPGACPSTCAAPSSASFSSSAGSPAMTPGKFIISARPITRRRRRRPWRSPAVSGRRGDSKADAGTHDDAVKYTSRGRPEQTSSSQWMPSVPRTFAISCGSATTAVVPIGNTRRANSSTSSFVDSRCMCASMKPGTTYAPPTSSVSCPSYSPRPAT